MRSDRTVACVLRSGGLYTAAWVDRLARSIARHMPGVRFVALSDCDVPCERIPLAHDWRGWWSKIELFRPGVLDGPTVYVDLDTIVLGSLAPLFDAAPGLTLLRDFYAPEHVNSSVMAWTCGADVEPIYDAFRRDPRGYMRTYDHPPRFRRRAGPLVGDQAFIEHHAPRLATFDDVLGCRAIASYKADQCRDAAPSDALAVTFHGKPKPHAIREGWVANEWSGHNGATPQ